MRLMPTWYEEWYVKTNKSDCIDAEAIVKAPVIRPEPVASVNGASNIPQTNLLSRLGELPSM